MKIKMMKGLPGSGKSTEAKRIVGTGNSGRVNRDDLRNMIFNGVWTGKREGIIVEIEKAIAGILMKHNVVPVIDDTNLFQSHHDMWSNFAKNVGANLEVVEVNTPLDECIARDAVREAKVGRVVITRMALRAGMIDFGDKPIVVVDLDGTVADETHRHSHIIGNKKNWNAYFGGISGDVPYDVVVRWVQELSSDHTILVLTGRPDNYEDATVAQLEKFGLPYDYLLMRAAKDMREDTQIKGEIVDLLPKNQIAFAIDDREGVIQTFRNKGIKVYPVHTVAGK